MHNVKQITHDIYWVGANDRRLFIFEGVYSVPNGVSYNSYLLLDDKVVLFDTVDKAVSELFFENIEHVLNGRNIDYLVIHHMEPDHSATIAEVCRRYPTITIVCNALTKKMIDQYFTMNPKQKYLIVNEGDLFETANHRFTFVNAPMVHWPEVIMSYDLNEKLLFSADAFGTFGALDGAIFADELDFFKDYIDDARRYYTNIVGKYGPQVQNVLKKASTLEIDMILPLHGPVWRENLNSFISLYDRWSKYVPEKKGVLIAYASVYGHTENVAEILASKLVERGLSVKVIDTSVTDSSYVVSESFKYSHLVFASTTYNMGVFIKMDETLRDLAAHNIQNRTIALIENGSWAPTSKSLMKDILKMNKNLTFIDKEITILSSLKESQLEDLNILADKIAESVKLTTFDEGNENKINVNGLFKISYGLYLLTAKEGEKDNGCIINTAQLVTDNPNQISFTIHKNNLTHDMVVENRKVNVSILSTTAPFSLFKKFGFVSGRDENKFENFKAIRTSNGLLTLDSKYSNAYISAEVVQIIDLGSHSLFIAKVCEAKVLSNKPSMTYQYYFDHVKPQMISATTEDKKKYVCKICGYVYDGETLPDDYLCPLCGVGKEEFKEQEVCRAFRILLPAFNRMGYNRYMAWCILELCCLGSLLCGYYDCRNYIRASLQAVQ